jgi:ferredoxin
MRNPRPRTAESATHRPREDSSAERPDAAYDRACGGTHAQTRQPELGTKDTACVDACPVDCIHPKKNTTYDDGRPAFDDVPQLYIDPVECIDCGACVPVCPVSAIFVLDDLPEKWKQYTELNESYVKAGKFTPEEFAKHQGK